MGRAGVGKMRLRAVRLSPRVILRSISVGKCVYDGYTASIEVRPTTYAYLRFFSIDCYSELEYTFGVCIFVLVALISTDLELY